MKHLAATIIKLVLPIALACATSAAWGQATRTWVSGVGDDVNPCSRTAPCKTFAGAISKTADCGEIDVLDAGGFGAVTITKPITIDGLGPMASILVSGTSGIIVNVTSTTGGCPLVVTLRNLQINGIGNGISGIRFIAGDELHVENVNVFGFRSGSGVGLDFNPAGTASALYVQNSTFTNNSNQGIWLRPSGIAVVNASIKTTKLSQNGVGMAVSNNAYAVVSDSEAAGNASYGFQAVSTGPAAKLQLDRCVASDNGSGVRTDGAGAVVRLSSSSIVGNVTGLAFGGGIIMSFGNNVIAGNTPGGDGAPTMTSTLK